MEMHADAEHQQDDADFRELRCDAAVGDKARRMRADGDAREQVTDERRQSQAVRDPAEQKREREPAGEQRDDRQVMHASYNGAPIRRPTSR